MERFWNKVDIGPPDQCWNFIGGIGRAGYGVFAVKSGRGFRSVSAHRFAWQCTNGDIPEGLFVCHHCDNKACCNPAHLFLGTPLDNTQDMIRKGRRVEPSVRNRARGENHPSQLRPGYLPTGEDHQNSVLCEAAVRHIRSSGEPGTRLAAHYGVSAKTVSRIRRREAWVHVP